MSKDRQKSFETDVNDIETMEMTGTSSAETSPGSGIPNLGDLTLEKESDRKTLKKDLYDLKLRIYYMEQKEKILKGEDGDDIYQKYMDLQSEYEKLSKNLDEKEDLLVKATKVATYVREEKEKLVFEFQDKEKFYREHIQQLEKELEDMKLCNPKFGLHNSVFMSGDSGDSSSFSASKDQKRINEMEYQIHQLNTEIEKLKGNNDHLEKTVHNLQRKIILCNKEISELNSELSGVQKERDLAVENCARNDEIINKIEKDKQKLELQLAQLLEENEKTNNSVSSTDQQPVPKHIHSSTSNCNSKSDEAAATLIRHLLTENKQMNSKLRKVKEELLLVCELCSSCPTCVKEKKLKKASMLSLRQKSVASTSEDENADANSSKSENETDQCDSLNKIKEAFELGALLREKDKVIKQLRAENKKCTYNLQELVNKELWDKNREIEKLNKQCDKQKHEIDFLRKQSGHSNHAMRELQSNFVRNYNSDGKENILAVSDDVKLLKEQLRACLEEKKALLHKISLLESKITSDEEQKAQTSLVNNLRMECAKHRDEFEEAEKARKDAFNACALLTNRLEELACFLESLLAHDVTGLNAKRRELLKQAIERSREISKSFSCTFADPETASIVGTKFESSVDLSAPILPDCSEINWSFSCGEDDEDEMEIASRTLKPDDVEAVNYDQIMNRSTEFASTEDSDAYPIKKSVLFINNLNANKELIFCTQGMQLRDDDTATETTDEPRPLEKCEKCCSNMVPSSTLTSSVPVSSDEAPKIADFDSESEPPAKPSRFTVTSSGTKLRARRLRPEPCYSTDSDASVRSGKKFIFSNDMRQMQRRIQYLERINESLRKELKHQRSYPEIQSTVEKTDVEKIREKTQLRNLLNKINLENCVDTEKYRDCVENIRRNLRDLTKHLKSKKFDKSYISVKLKEVSEYFEFSELCCTKLSQHLEHARNRTEKLTGLLEETESKFEQVLLDLHATKLAYNSVILEHEQNIFKYKQSEMANEQLREKLKSTEELRHNLESDLRDAKTKTLVLEQDVKSNQLKTARSCEYENLKELLDKALRRIKELESFVTVNDKTLEELSRCKKNVQKLTEENEKLLHDLEEVSKYKSQIEEYEGQLKLYKMNSERLELELFEKDAIEKLYKEQCAKLEEEMEEKSNLHNTLKLTSDELKETRAKIEELETKMCSLNDLLRDKENIIVEKDFCLSELKNEKENHTWMLNELKAKTELEMSVKIKTIDELQDLLKLSEEKTKKFEREIDVLKSLLSTCEDEKREYRLKIEKQVVEYENLKRQHEQKMKHLLAQIVAYRSEEESSLAAHRQLVEQIEEAQQKKELWRKSIQDWKEKYEELKKEKEQIEEKLQCSVIQKRDLQLSNPSTSKMDNELVKCAMERDWFVKEAELRYQLDVATLTTSHVILEWTRLANEKLRLQRELHRRDKPYYVNHLESIKSQLENRVKELETANKELETRLQRLQTNKVTHSDLDFTSEDSSRAGSPVKKTCPFDFSSFAVSNTSTFKTATTTTGYSSSLPSSPSHIKCASPVMNSEPNSPVLQKDGRYTAQNPWLASRDAYKNPLNNLLYDDVFCDKINERLMATSPKHSSENIATSPDLGIDSDHGRSSSFDFDPSNKDNNVKTEITKLEKENQTLKRELGQTRKELEETLGKLTALNKNKKKMEKAIFKQIYETKHILQRARVNLEDGNPENNGS